MNESAARAAAVEAAEQELNHGEPWLTPNDAATAAVVTALDHLASTDEGRAYLLRRVFSEDDIEILLSVLPGWTEGKNEGEQAVVRLRAAFGERES